MWALFGIAAECLHQVAYSGNVSVNMHGLCCLVREMRIVCNMIIVIRAYENLEKLGMMINDLH